MKRLDDLIMEAEMFLILAQKHNYPSRKEYKLFEQDFIDADPELKTKHLEQLKKRQQAWRSRQDPQKLKQINQESWNKIKELKKNNPINFLLIHLGRQVAFKRRDEKSKNKPEILNAFEIIANQIINFKNKINNYLEQEKYNELLLVQLINEGEQLSNTIRPVFGAASKTINAIINELNLIFEKQRAY